MTSKVTVEVLSATSLTATDKAFLAAVSAAKVSLSNTALNVPDVLAASKNLEFLPSFNL